MDGQSRSSGVYCTIHVLEQWMDNHVVVVCTVHINRSFLKY